MSDLPRKVILGMHELYKNEPLQIEALAQELFVHERYDRSDQDNDLMLIKVSYHVTGWSCTEESPHSNYF